MGCVNSVKTVLKNVLGVIQAEVTLDPAQAIIQYDPANTSVTLLKESILDAGFEVID